MSDPNLIVLYVNNPAASSKFYSELIGHNAAESSPNFVMFALQNGLMLGLWAKDDVVPATTMSGGGTEIAFTVENEQKLDEAHSLWKGRGMCIVQAPVQMDFGYTFVALDPDAHRLRVFSPTAR